MFLKEFAKNLIDALLCQIFRIPLAQITSKWLLLNVKKKCSAIFL